VQLEYCSERHLVKTSLVLPLAFIAALLFVSKERLAAQVNYNGGTYTQNFDGLPVTGTQTLTGKGPFSFADLTSLTISGMDGWQFGNPLGTSANTEFKTHNGSLAGSAGRGVVSFGVDGETDRALGALPTSNQVSRFGLLLVNSSGLVMENVTVSFTGEQWRRGDRENGPNTLLFAYGTTNNADGINGAGVANLDASLNFVSPITTGATEIALNGNLPGNQVFRSAVLSGFQWNPGEILAVRWTMNDITGQDDGLAIDNFSFTATAVPEPSAFIILGGLGMILTVGKRRR
jgi:large repetitive protein